MMEEMKTIADMLIGMSKNDWDNLKMSVDMYFTKKVANLVIDDKKELEVYLNRKS